MKKALLFAVVLGLSACQSHDVAYQSIDINTPPKPNAYTANAHPLGIGQPTQKDATAYLLLGDSIQQADRAKTACMSLFGDTSLTIPMRAKSPEQVVTYIPVDKAGDFTRTSSRFKWGLCKQIVSAYGRAKEQALLDEIGYGRTHGPLLVGVLDTNEGKNKAVVADLSMVTDDNIPTVIQNWLDISASKSKVHVKRKDLAELSMDLNRGLDDWRVVLSILPENKTNSVAYLN